jgi:glutathione S-transferase
MTSALKPIILYGGLLGPNPPKVAILLGELGLPYETKQIPITEVKGPEYTKINPNGRLPAIEDPNTGITIWESGAILEYLVAEYDKDYKLSFPAGTPEFYHAKQWLHFQMSGQGPYYGQVFFFKHYHSEKVQSVIDRFIKEAKRVSKVLDTHLESREWLVGDKCTYVDLAFLPWQAGVASFLEGEPLGCDPAKEFPHVEAWMDRMKAKPAVAKIWEARNAQRAALVKAQAEKAAEDKK